MTRADYLNQLCVIAFVGWLREIIQGHVPIEFRYGANPENVWHTLYCALEGYRWPHVTNNGLQPHHCTNWPFPEGARFHLPANSILPVNEAVLDRLKAGLRDAMSTNGNDPAPWVAAILIWGGVYTKTKNGGGNRGWLERNCNQIKSIVNDTMEALSADDDDLIEFLNLRFNSGMTKVYSLLLENFIIYDSRVAAALAWLVWQWCRSRDPAVPLPPLLAFACPTARGGGIRNPDEAAFPYLNVKPREHAKWNLRANWILQEAFTLPNSGKTSIAPGNFNSLREVEAALFTMGYDLTHAINP